MCFMKAEDKYSERLAEAYQLRAIAEGINSSEIERKKVFKEAAELFQSLGKHMLAAECFYEMEDYETAGNLLLSFYTTSFVKSIQFLKSTIKLSLPIRFTWIHDLSL